MRSDPASRRRAAALLALACGACFNPTGGDTATTTAATTDSTIAATGTAATAGPTTAGTEGTASSTGDLTTGTTAVSPTTTAATTEGTSGPATASSTGTSGSTTGDGPVCGNDKLESGEECDDNNILDGDGCSAACQFEQRFVFLTSVKFAPTDLMSLGDAGERCKTLADSAEALPELNDRKWVAWLSDADTDAVEQLGGFPGDYILPDEHVLVAEGVAGLTSSQLLAPINETEKGTAAASIVPCDQNPDDPVWTGTNAGGTEAAGFHCTGWSTDAGVAFTGVYSANDSTWTECGTLVCTSLARLYCVEI